MGRALLAAAALTLLQGPSAPSATAHQKAETAPVVLAPGYTPLEYTAPEPASAGPGFFDSFKSGNARSGQ